MYIGKSAKNFFHIYILLRKSTSPLRIPLKISELDFRMQQRKQTIHAPGQQSATAGGEDEGAEWILDAWGQLKLRHETIRPATANSSILASVLKSRLLLPPRQLFA